MKRGQGMAIEFKEKVEIKPIGTPEVAASRLEAQLDKHLPCPPFEPGRVTLDSSEWRLRDPSGSGTEGANVAEVFEEFREHDLEPHALFQNRLMPSTKEGERGVFLRFYYRIHSSTIYVDIEGTNRIAVDGVAATCRRIKRTLENPVQAIEASHGASENKTSATLLMDGQGSPNAEIRSRAAELESPPRSWLSRTWKDHTAQFVLTVIAGVLAVAIALWLGLSPRP